MAKIPVGAKGVSALKVQSEHLANRFKDSILPEVFATPMMVRLMECGFTMARCVPASSS